MKAVNWPTGTHGTAQRKGQASRIHVSTALHQTSANLDRAFGIFLLSHHTLSHPISHKPHVSLITGCVRWDDQGFAFHSVFTQVLFTPHRAKTLDISQNGPGDQFPLSRYPASTIWQGCQLMLMEMIKPQPASIQRCLCCFQSSYPSLSHIVGCGSRTYSLHVMANKPLSMGHCRFANYQIGQVGYLTLHSCRSSDHFCILAMLPSGILLGLLSIDIPFRYPKQEGVQL
ncbi:hypothetical protein B0T13DRAFT_67812 [Neurospora crassa]|nr:hypothetical protein B0T13DRAFT_67812 [Neurospora crassa]